jgi:hypothetical protein
MRADEHGVQHPFATQQSGTLHERKTVVQVLGQTLFHFTPAFAGTIENAHQTPPM